MYNIDGQTASGWYLTNGLFPTLNFFRLMNQQFLSDLNHHTVKISKPYNSPDPIIISTHKTQNQIRMNNNQIEITSILDEIKKNLNNHPLKIATQQNLPDQSNLTTNTRV
jgi:hypothetical protein